MVREARMEDLRDILELYTLFHGEPAADLSAAKAVLAEILADPNQYLLVYEAAGRAAASCACTVVPNLNRGLRPYALVENVVTHPDFRRRGMATACLDRAREIARTRNCYKLMLMTGAKEPGVLAFYERAGYNRRDKTAFINWLA